MSPSSAPGSPSGDLPFLESHIEAQVSKWQESLFAVDLLLLFTSPVFYGIGVPRGDGSAVMLIPGFLDWDTYLRVMSVWLKRIGYRPYLSGMGLNADCPDLLVRYRLARKLSRARRDTGKRVHLIGHSLGGIMARALAVERPQDVASLTMLGSPFRGTVAHRSVLFSSELVRRYIHRKHGSRVLPQCYTARCTCEFMQTLRRAVPGGIAQTAIYTRTDGVLDWRYCRTGNPKIDVEVTGTHSGLAFNPAVYSAIAARIAATR